MSAHHHKPNSKQINERERERVIRTNKQWVSIVASLAQTGRREKVITTNKNEKRRERVARMNKQSNAYRRKPNSTRRKRVGRKNEQTIECLSSQA